MQKKTDLTAMSTFAFLFFALGFVTSMNTILIPFMKNIFKLTDASSLLINLFWYGAFGIGSIPSSYITEKYGYKKGMLAGLSVCTLGGLMYFPAAVLVSYPFFLMATLCLALGICLLQMSITPFVLEIGSQDTTSVRMNICGTTNSFATIIAPAIGGFVFLGTINSFLTPQQQQAMNAGLKTIYSDLQIQQMSQSLKLPYLCIASTFALVAIVLLFIKLPQIQRKENEKGTIRDAWKHRQLRFGALAIFVYLGLEIAAPSFMVRYATDKAVWGIEQQEASQYITYYFLAMMIGRFTGIFVMKKINDKIALTAYAIAGAVLVSIGLLSKGWIAILAFVLSGLCQSIMWSSIFTLGTMGLGYLTNKASGVMLTAVMGGGIITLAMGAIADHFGVKAALSILIFGYVYMIWFAQSAHRLREKSLL